MAGAKSHFDFIVTGVGSMGAAACYYLARRGYRVLGLEQFSIPHENGSHAGQSRIIRAAYFEHPGYVPLLKRAYENWSRLEQEASEQLYHPTGLVYMGRPGHAIMQGVKQSSNIHQVDVVSSKDFPSLLQRFPFQIPGEFEMIHEPAAGFVRPEKTITLYCKLASQYGASIHSNEKVLEWRKDGDGIRVTTSRASYRAGKLLITAGAWQGQLLPSLKEKLKVTRQVLAWIHPDQPERFLPDKFPCWMIADDRSEGVFYGFPYLTSDNFGGVSGLKLAHHYPGEVTGPERVNREVTKQDLDNLLYCLDRYLPGAFKAISAAKVCLYTNSPDENFIIDILPGFGDKVVIACGFSGHGFKFVPVVGEILADLAEMGKTRMPVGFLGLARLA